MVKRARTGEKCMGLNCMQAVNHACEAHRKECALLFKARPSNSTSVVVCLLFCIVIFTWYSIVVARFS